MNRSKFIIYLYWSVFSVAKKRGQAALEWKRVIQGALGQFRKEPADSVGDQGRERLALGGRGGPRIAGSRVGRQQVPRPRDLDPASVDSLEPAGLDRAGVGLFERDQVGKWARPMLVSISPAWSSFSLKIVA